MMLKQGTEYLDDDDAVYICYHLDGSLINLGRLQGHTNTLDQLFRNLLFYDDTALITHKNHAVSNVLLYKGYPALWTRGHLEEDRSPPPAYILRTVLPSPHHHQRN